MVIKTSAFFLHCEFYYMAMHCTTFTYKYKKKMAHTDDSLASLEICKSSLVLKVYLQNPDFIFTSTKLGGLVRRLE